MKVTYIGLSEYYKRCIVKAKEKKYVLIISLIARYSDAPEVYKKMETDWASLNDLTNDNILFVFSTPQVKKKSSFFHVRGKESYEGVMCPFVELLNGQYVEDNNGPFEYLYEDYKKIDWKQKHSQTITAFARDYNIPENEIPCLFLYDLRKDRSKVIPISSKTDIYELLKRLINEISACEKKRDDIDHELKEYKNIDNYYFLYEQLQNIAKQENTQQSVAIEKVLLEKLSYKEAKKDIVDARVRKDLKRIGKWKKQYIIQFEENEIKKQQYYELKCKKSNIEDGFDIVWEKLSSVELSKKLVCREAIIKDLLEACVKLQANTYFTSALENQRNDYIRDMLKMAGYEVCDQTRRGKSFSEKSAGEVDILIEKDGFPVTIIEALNLNSLNTNYLDIHIDKIYSYDTVGNTFNVVLSYVQVSDFGKFTTNYFGHISKREYLLPLIEVCEKVEVEGCNYSNMRVMKTVHNRNGCETILYHICILLA